MKLFKKRGALLLITLCITVIMGIFLMSVVQSLASNVFFTKKVSMEIKSYWAANAGIEYANMMLSKYPKWPAENAIGGTIGGFAISGGGSDALIHGSDSLSGADFYIPFSSTSGSINSAAASKGLDFYSYNNTQKSNAVSFNASPLKGKTVRVPAYGVYIASEGRAGAFKSGIEELVTISALSAASSSGAVYARNSINATGLGSPLLIQTKTNGTNVAQGASIVSKGSIKVSTTDSSYSPVDLGGGHLYVNSGGATLNGKNIKPKSFLNQYDVSVLSSATINEPEFKFPTVKGNSIPAGTFVWIQRPASNEDENTLFYSEFYKSIYTEDVFKRIWYDNKLKDIKEDGTEFRYGEGGSGAEVSAGGEDSGNPPPASEDESNNPTSDDLFNTQYETFIGIRVTNRTKRETAIAAELPPGYVYYEPCFIPDSLDIYKPDGEGKVTTINFKTTDYAYAKELMALKTQLEEQEQALEGNIFTNKTGLFQKLLSIFAKDEYKAFLEAEEARNATKEQIANYEKSGVKYEFVKVDPGTSGADIFYCLVPASESASSPFTTNDLKAFNFVQSGKKLTLELKESIQVNGNFNFATFERTGDGSYKLSENKRGIVKMGEADAGNETTISASGGINVSGIITGRGQLLSTNGNINIEAGADVDGGEENYLAVYTPSGSININQISATSSTIVGNSADGTKSMTFNSVASDFVQNVLGIDTDDEKLCNDYLTGAAEISVTDLCKTYVTIDGKSYSYVRILNGFDVTASDQEAQENIDETYLCDSVRAKINEYLKAQSSGSSYSVASNFKGILAANKDIKIAGASQAYGLSLEGVIVAQTGSLNISNLNSVRIVYDPSLSSIMANLPGATTEPILEVIGVNRF